MHSIGRFRHEYSDCSKERWNYTYFYFATDTCQKISLKNITILYKDFDKKKNLEEKYSGTLSKEDLAAMLENPSAVKVSLSIENQTHVFSSEDFSQKLFELGVLVK